MHRGIIYAVTGEPKYYAECEKSVLSLRRHGYQESILLLVEDPALWTGMPDPDLEVRRVEHDAGFSLSRRIKTSLATMTPFAETLFLDTDTEILCPLDDIWSYLDTCDLALCPDDVPALAVIQKTFRQRIHSPEELLATRERCPPEAAHYNSGVLLFKKNSATEALFANWCREWERFKNRDQLALMRALAATRISIAAMPERFNCHVRRAGEGSTVIYHYWYEKRLKPAEKETKTANKPSLGAKISRLFPGKLGAWITDRRWELYHLRNRLTARRQLPRILRYSRYWREFL